MTKKTDTLFKQHKILYNLYLYKGISFFNAFKDYRECRSVKKNLMELHVVSDLQNPLIMKYNAPFYKAKQLKIYENNKTI